MTVKKEHPRIHARLPQNVPQHVLPFSISPDAVIMPLSLEFHTTVQYLTETSPLSSETRVRALRDVSRNRFGGITARGFESSRPKAMMA